MWIKEVTFLEVW